MPVDKNDATLTLDGCWRWTNGNTWHPRIWHGNREVPDPEVECFEVEWDAEGVPKVTGRTQMMRATQARATQGLHSEDIRCPHCPQWPTFYGIDRSAEAAAWAEAHSEVCEARKAEV